MALPPLLRLQKPSLPPPLLPQPHRLLPLLLLKLPPPPALAPKS